MVKCLNVAKSQTIHLAHGWDDLEWVEVIKWIQPRGSYFAELQTHEPAYFRIIQKNIAFLFLHLPPGFNTLYASASASSTRTTFLFKSNHVLSMTMRITWCQKLQCSSQMIHQEKAVSGKIKEWWKTDSKTRFHLRCSYATRISYTWASPSTQDMPEVCPKLAARDSPTCIIDIVNQISTRSHT